MALIRKLSVLAVEKQGTAGTAETLVGADAVRVSDVSLALNNLAMADRSTVSKPSFGGLQNLYVGTLMDISFTWEIALEHDATEKTRVVGNDLLEACGLNPGAFPNSGVRTGTEYKLQNTHKIVTVGWYEDGNVTILRDAIATAVSLNFTGKETAKATITLTGVISSRARATLTPTFNAALPLVVANATVTTTNLSGGAVVLDGVQCEFGLETAFPVDITAADGFAAPVTTNRNMTCTISPQALAYNVSDFLDKLQNDTIVDLSVQIARGSDKLKARWQRCAITNWSPTDQEGVAGAELSLQCISSDAGGDEMVIRTFR